MQGEARRARSFPEKDIEQLAEKIIAHAQAEEEVMYPAAMLVGAWLHATAPLPSADGPAGEGCSRGGGED